MFYMFLKSFIIMLIWLFLMTLYLACKYLCLFMKTHALWFYILIHRHYHTILEILIQYLKIHIQYLQYLQYLFNTKSIITILTILSPYLQYLHNTYDTHTILTILKQIQEDGMPRMGHTRMGSGLVSRYMWTWYGNTQYSQGLRMLDWLAAARWNGVNPL